MRRLWLRVRAPFAAYRGMQAGVFRGTAPTMTVSAAHGLLCNLAGIETRGDLSELATPRRADCPVLRVAIGSVREPEISSLYQQLHTYPVGKSGEEYRARTHGAKHWIAPTRRELLVGLDVVLGIEALEGAVLERIEKGVRGEGDWPRYGLPFAGDNQLLFDRLDLLPEPPPLRWYARLSSGDRPRRGSARLTIAIDRAEASATTNGLYAPLADPTVDPPESAWTWVPAAPASTGGRSS